MVKARKKLAKGSRRRGLFQVSKVVQKFGLGEKVVLLIEPSVPGGRPHPRYHGRVGVVRGRVGRAYEVEFKDGGKIKKVIITPEHLKRVAG